MFVYAPLRSDLTPLVLRDVASHIEAGDTWHDGDWVPPWMGLRRPTDVRANLVAALCDIAEMSTR